MAVDSKGSMHYFRHSWIARNDDFVLGLMDKFGKAGYFYWFTLIELCAEQCADGYQEYSKFHESRLYRELKCNSRKLKPLLDYMKTKGKLDYNYSEKFYQLSIVNLPFYIGKYKKPKQKVPPKENKIKENKIKEKKVSDFGPPEDKVINLFNEIVAGNGRVQYYAGVSLPPKARDEYFTLCGFEGFQSMDDFISYFKLIRNTPKLMGTDERFNVNISLPWLLQADNAIKIKSGQYQSDLSAEQLRDLERDKLFPEGY